MKKKVKQNRRKFSLDLGITKMENYVKEALVNKLNMINDLLEKIRMMRNERYENKKYKKRKNKYGKISSQD